MGGRGRIGFFSNWPTKPSSHVPHSLMADEAKKGRGDLTPHKRLVEREGQTSEQPNPRLCVGSMWGRTGFPKRYDVCLI